MTKIDGSWYRELRRQDRALSHEATLAVIDSADYGVLSLAWPDGRPYCVPINHGRVDDVIYMHCGTAGQKLDIMRQNPRAVLCVTHAGPVVTGGTPCDASISFRSAMVFGILRELEDEREKMAGLTALCRQLGVDVPEPDAPDYEAYLTRAGATIVLAMDVEYMSGKARA